MNKIVAKVEKTGTGYCAYIPDIPGISSAADTLDELKKNVKESLELYIETTVAYGEPFPDILKCDYILEFQF